MDDPAESTPPRGPSAEAIPPLAVTMGDPAGVGLDILLDVWVRRRALDLPELRVFGDGDALAARAALLRYPAAALDDLSIETSARCPAPVAAGRPDPANGPAVISAIAAAVTAIHAGRASAVVTLPIAKETLYASGFRYPGHTEFLAALAAAHWPEAAPVRSVMMLASDELRVVPLTIHIPLAAVPGAITTDAIVGTVRIMAAALERDFAMSLPRIAVCGLNPHAGEGGTIGREEETIIRPALAALRAEGYRVTGPHSADTLFHAPARTRYDAVLAMYHDQALIPIKTLAFDRGVNVTLGLPFVRTSPDHGTAFDIAGAGTASPESFLAALRLAADLARRRAASVKSGTAPA